MLNVSITTYDSSVHIMVCNALPTKLKLLANDHKNKFKVKLKQFLLQS